MAIFPSSAIPSGAEAFTLDQSLRFEDGSSAYLSRTPASASNRRTFTFSVWFKRDNISYGAPHLFQPFTDVNNYDAIMLNSSDQMIIKGQVSGSSSYNYTTNQKFRDVSAWYHIVVAFDTTNGSAGDRIRLYVNGTEVTSFATETNPSEDLDTRYNLDVLHRVGANGSGGELYGGYMAEMHFIDGTALTPSSFGEAGDYGEWKAKEVEGLTYGTNGFYLSFAGGGIMSATGGDSIGTDGDYKYNTFLSDGTFTPSADGYVEYLVIAGGGAGAADGATTRGNGAGGAGGYRTGYLAVTASTAYSITVGDGGVGALSANSIEGDDSVFSSITSAGGGGGGWYTSTPGEAGGSGGGGAPPSAAGGAASPAGQGYAGEAGDTNLGGGGGGAGEAGGTDGAGQGGDGLASSITGSSVTRAGGGGGSQASGGAKAGGDGGGGAGGNGGAGTSGTANTGGGGGGGVSGGASGSGGSGIVIIRYKFQ